MRYEAICISCSWLLLGIPRVYQQFPRVCTYVEKSIVLNNQNAKGKPRGTGIITSSLWTLIYRYTLVYRLENPGIGYSCRGLTQDTIWARKKNVPLRTKHSFLKTETAFKKPDLQYYRKTSVYWSWKVTVTLVNTYFVQFAKVLPLPICVSPGHLHSL